MIDIFEEGNLPQLKTIDFSRLNKTALGMVSGAVIEQVDNGTEDPLEMYLKAKALLEVANGIISGLKDAAKDEAEKYSKAGSSLLGCEFVVKNGSDSYSYNHDVEWVGINNQIIILKEKLKEREKKMVDATRYAELVDDATGEIVPPALIKKAGGTVLTVTIPKK